MNIDNQITLDCAFRYALGRMTYVTEAVSNVIIDCWDALPFSKKEMIVAEIKKAIEENRIGMECDKVAWQRIVLLHESTKDTSLTKPIILDNNPISIAKYAEEYPDNWKKISNAKSTEKPNRKEICSCGHEAKTHKQRIGKCILCNCKRFEYSTNKKDAFEKWED